MQPLPFRVLISFIKIDLFVIIHSLLIIVIFIFSHQECLIYRSRNSNLHSFCFSLSMTGVCMQVILGSHIVDLSSTSTWYQISRSSCPYSIYERFGLAFKSVFSLSEDFFLQRFFLYWIWWALIFGSL